MAQNDATTRFIGALNALDGAITRREVKDKEEEEKVCFFSFFLFWPSSISVAKLGQY